MSDWQGWATIIGLVLFFGLTYVTGRTDGYRQGRMDELREQMAAGEREMVDG